MNYLQIGVGIINKQEPTIPAIKKLNGSHGEHEIDSKKYAGS